MSAATRRGGLVLPLAQWPEADQRAWAEGIDDTRIFDRRPRPACKWRPATLALICAGYGRWLGWLSETGRLDLATTPASRVTEDQVLAYRYALALTDSDYTVAGRIQQLGDALRSMEPYDDWSWILRGSSRLRAEAKPAKDKLGRLRPTEELVQLGLDLIHKAASDPHLTEVVSAKMHRDGLMIALVALRPMRGSNLHAIAEHQHLTERGGVWRLSFAPSDTKNGDDLNAIWPDSLVAHLECYLAVHRPRLLACSKRVLPPTQQLWISSHGTPMTYCAVALQIRARTKAAFGTSVTPHYFRDCAATTIATHTPERGRDVALVLGHRGLKTSERHYNHAKDITAIAKAQEIIEAIQSQAIAKRRTATGRPGRGARPG